MKFYLCEFFGCLFSQLIRRSFNMSEYVIDKFKNTKCFFVRINSNKLIIKFLLYCFLLFYFMTNISITITISIASHSYNLIHDIVLVCFLLQMKFLFLSALIVLWLRRRHIVWIIILLWIYVLLLLCNPWLLWLLILCLQKFCWFVFLTDLLGHIYVFYSLKKFFFPVVIHKFLSSNPSYILFFI